MKFFVVRVKFLKDGTLKKSELMEYDSKVRAVAKFHSNVGTDMDDDSLAGGMCVVLNEHGGSEEKVYWTAEEETNEQE